YRFILGRILAGLSPYVSGLVVQGSSDLTLAERKFSGNAQQRKRSHLLHHGTLLFAFDPTPAPRYLKMPPRQPEYRRQRSHVDFLTNLPIVAEALERIMREIWQADEVLGEWPSAKVKKMVDEKYECDEWIRRR